MKYNLNHVNYKFKELNDYRGFGKAEGYVYLRSHMFRKFNSTCLNQGTLEGNLLGMDSINLLNGRGKNKTGASYFK